MLNFNLYGLNQWWEQAEIEMMPSIPPTSSNFLVVEARTLRADYNAFCEKMTFFRANDVIIGKFLSGKYESKFRATLHGERPWAYVFNRAKLPSALDI